MEMVDATIVRQDDQVSLKIELDPPLEIPLSEDNANRVKASFNALLRQLRLGAFSIRFMSNGTDLFNQVATEYVTQLNSELEQIFHEMEQHGLVECAEDEGE